MINVEFGHRLPDFLAELLHRHQVFTFLAVGIANVGDRMPQEVSDLHPGNRDRVLEGQKHTQASPLAGVKFANVAAVELNRTAGDLVLRMSSQRVGERALPGAVRPHQSMNFALTHGEIDPLEDRSLSDGNVQVSDLQRDGHGQRFGNRE